MRLYIAHVDRRQSMTCEDPEIACEDIVMRAQEQKND